MQDKLILTLLTADVLAICKSHDNQNTHQLSRLCRVLAIVKLHFCEVQKGTKGISKD
jgi:uncharacterized iron-regulated protein